MKQKLLLITLILVATFGTRTWLARPPRVPHRQALEAFPATLAAPAAGAWVLTNTQRLDADTMSVLKANDYLMREYRMEGGPLNGDQAQLFVAYYRNQSAGDAMHSPKNCLPGAGWDPIANDTVPLGMNAPDGKPALVNRYVVENAGARDIVLYWYQAQGRIIASEYWSKFYLVWDAMRQHRRDGAIVRVVVSIPFGQALAPATQVALSLARASERQLPPYLPN